MAMAPEWQFAFGIGRGKLRKQIGVYHPSAAWTCFQHRVSERRRPGTVVAKLVVSVTWRRRCPLLVPAVADVLGFIDSSCTDVGNQISRHPLPAATITNKMIHAKAAMCCRRIILTSLFMRLLG